MKKNVRKQHLPANANSSVNMKFSYMIARRKEKISYFSKFLIVTKTRFFYWCLGQLFFDNI